ncbi:MAG: 4-(cytidine 5'-diphospho)-2-C-methyl-D-erythritol kinase [Firmicutes bacterium]|nr:4-(cytidine 5'-diphospho)-2-C-methyl-D-erythritol kinase [Bacillota bacterium]
MAIDAYGKINLSLDVLRRREDGYHDLRMIMQQIDLKDTVMIENIDEDKVIIESNNIHVPTDSSNLVYKAWKLICEKYNIKKGIKIYIKKNIPIAAGLAGGSSNAAAVLKGLNILWDLRLTQGELMSLGLKIGADVPYCIMGGTALAEGVGEKLTALSSFKDRHILLANPGVTVSTAYVYNNLDLSNVEERPKTNELIKAIEADNLMFVANNLVNLLETVTIKRYPIIADIKQKMIEKGALGSIMSGSGPTVFGIFDNKEVMQKCKKELEKSIDIVIVTKTC